MHGMKRISVLMFLKITVYNVHLLNMRGQKKRVMKSLLKNVSSNIYKVAKFCFLHCKEEQRAKGDSQEDVAKIEILNSNPSEVMCTVKNRLKKLH
jgi:hypothetical protein